MHPSQHYEIARQRHVEKLHLAEQVRLARAVEAQEQRMNPWARIRRVVHEHRLPAPRTSLGTAP